MTSLDGYVVDAQGSFDWAAPDDEVHAFVNDRERPIGTHLYGRRTDDVLRYGTPSVPGWCRVHALRRERQRPERG